MAIRFRCPQCSKEYQVGEEFAGRQAKCKACGATMSIPSTAAPAQVPTPPAGQSVYAQPPAGQGAYAQPYAPGAVPPPLPVRRPASVTVIAVLQIIFNSLALLGVLLAILQLAGLWIQTKESQMIWEDSVQRTWTYIKVPISAVVGVLWIGVCVGLLRLRRWARSTALGLVVLDIVVSVAGLVVAVYVYQAGPMAKLVRDQPQIVRTAMSIGFIVGIFFAVLAIGYYVLVLILLTRRKVADAFEAAGRQQLTPGV